MTTQWFYLIDENGEPIDVILFEPAYQFNYTNSKLVYLVSDLSYLQNVTITPVAVDEDLIPFTMQEASKNSYKYVQLSTDNVTFHNSLSIPLIDHSEPYPIYVRAFVPDYAIEGNFVCGLDVQATYFR
jgi:hypothetical protein